MVLCSLRPGGPMNFRVFAFSFFLLAGLAFAQDCSTVYPSVGTGFVSSHINFSQTPDLYFSVTGAPPNICGALATIRNGSCLYVPGWVCTDGNGQVTRGPWTWSGTPGDQTDRNIHFNWANGTTTNFTSDHIWDKTCPLPTVTSPSGGPPTSFYGTGSDQNWGAGFRVRGDYGPGTRVKLQFQDNSTGLYWNPSIHDYNLSSPPDIYATVTSGLGNITSPSYHSTWDGTASIPDNYQPGLQYTRTVILLDGDS